MLVSDSDAKIWIVFPQGAIPKHVLVFTTHSQNCPKSLVM